VLFFVIYDHSGVNDFIAILKKVVEAEFDSTELMGGNHPIVAVILLIAYVVTVTVLLINLLIAMMGSTFNKISETADMQWELERARIVFSIEDEMSVDERLNSKYWIDRDRERFILVEEADIEHFRGMSDEDKQVLAQALLNAPIPSQQDAKEPGSPTSPTSSINLSLSPSSPNLPLPDSPVFDASHFNPQTQDTQSPLEMPTRKKSKVDHHSE